MDVDINMDINTVMDMDINTVMVTDTDKNMDMSRNVNIVARQR
jgi:hypothetical protein